MFFRFVALSIGIAGVTGCTVFYRSDYFKQTLPGPGYRSVDCGNSGWFGAENGVAIPGPGKTLYVCSESQSGRWFTMGFLLPIFPVTGRRTWSEDLRWIKFGLKRENYHGWDNADSLEVEILGVEYADSGAFHIGPHARLFESRRIEKRADAPAKLKVLSEQDCWLGFPGKGDVLIEFEAEGFGRRKVRFTPTSGYGITFLSV